MPFTVDFRRILLGHHEPRRIRNGEDHRHHGHPAIVRAFHHPLPAPHGHDRRHVGFGQRDAQLEGGVRPMAQVVEKQHAVALALDEDGFRRPARGGPGLDQRVEKAGRVADQDHCAPRCCRRPVFGKNGRHHADVGHRLFLAGVQLGENRGALAKGLGQGFQVPLMHFNGFVQVQADLPPAVDQENIGVVVVGLEAVEVGADAAGVGFVRGSQETGCPLGEKGFSFHQYGGVRQPLGAPSGDALRFIAGNCGQLFGHGLPHGLLLAPVEPLAAYHEHQEGRQQ